MWFSSIFFFFFFFNDTATTEIYTLSLYDALPIWNRGVSGTAARSDSDDVGDFFGGLHRQIAPSTFDYARASAFEGDRKSTRLNSSHSSISYAVFCLKKKKKKKHEKHL